MDSYYPRNSRTRFQYPGKIFRIIQQLAIRQEDYPELIVNWKNIPPSVSSFFFFYYSLLFIFILHFFFFFFSSLLLLLFSSLFLFTFSFSSQSRMQREVKFSASVKRTPEVTSWLISWDLNCLFWLTLPTGNYWWPDTPVKAVNLRSFFFYKGKVSYIRCGFSPRGRSHLKTVRLF